MNTNNNDELMIAKKPTMNYERERANIQRTCIDECLKIFIDEC